MAFLKFEGKGGKRTFSAVASVLAYYEKQTFVGKEALLCRPGNTQHPIVTEFPNVPDLYGVEANEPNPLSKLRRRRRA